MKAEHLGPIDIISRAWPDWEIRDTIGSGAFATVYRASRKEQITGEKDSAIKIIRIPHDDSDWDRMLAEGKTQEQATEFFLGVVEDSLKEIRAMEVLSGHTNIVNILDYKRYHVPEYHVWYILIRMELLQKIDPAKMDEREIIRLGTDVCTALSICRKKNIVHRDVSLDNVFIHDGNYKLGDFGVAKVLEDATGSLQSIAGKPLYMAPEIYNATLTETDMDSAAKVDIYSLGILLYRLSHHMNYPFEDPDKVNIPASERSSAFKRRVINGETLPPPKYASPELAEIILKASAADPAKRYNSADEMRDALQVLSESRYPGPSERKKASVGNRRLARRKNRIIAVVIAVCLLIAAGIWFFVLPQNSDSPQSEPRNPVGLELDTCRVILTAPDNMNVKKFETTRKMLTERLDIFTEGFGGYKIETNANRMDIILPRAAFPKQKYDMTLMAFLVRPSQLYAFNDTDEQIVESYIKIERNDLEQVAIKAGHIDGLNASNYGIESNDYQYIEITLSDDFLTRFSSQIGSWDHFALMLDYEQYRNTEKKYYVFNTVSSGDRKTYYILVNAPDERIFRLIQYNLTHNPLPDTLDYTLDLNYLTAWQDRSNTVQWGQNQCNYSDLQGETVTFRLYSQLPTDGEVLDTLKDLKACLDTIGTPYAIGTSADEDYGYYTIAMPTSRTGVTLMEAISSESVYFRAGLSELFIMLKNIVVTTEPDSPCFTIALNPESSLYDKNTKAFQALLNKAVSNDEMIYICFEYGALPAMVIRPEDIQKDGTIRVSCLCNIQDGIPVARPLDPDERWYAEFVQELTQLSGYSPSVFFDSYQINTGFGELPPDSPGFIVQFDPGIDSLQKRIQPICRDAVVTATNNTICVVLDLPLDDFFPEQAGVMIQKIYESIDFPSMYANKLRFDLDAVTNHNPISAIFQKKYKDISNLKEGDDPENTGYIYFSVYSPLEPMESHCMKLMDVFNNSEFFKPYLTDESSWYIKW